MKRMFILAAALLAALAISAQEPDKFGLQKARFAPFGEV